MTEGFWAYPLLFAAAFAGGLIDAIAGGGGLITIPALLASGLPPQLALGTNKFQASFGSFTASLHYTRTGVVRPGELRAGILFTLIGAAAGAWTVQQIRIEVLATLIPFLLLAAGVYSLFSPRLGDLDTHRRFRELPFYAVTGLAFGFYDGFFGPGVGSFWAIALVTGLGHNLTRATGTTKVMNFTSNVVSLAVFLLGGAVVFPAGLLMAAGQIAGARIGAGLVIRRGAKLIRPVLVTVVLITTIKLLFDRFSSP